jgi:hypothetical protein
MDKDQQFVVWFTIYLDNDPIHREILKTQLEDGNWKEYETPGLNEYTSRKQFYLDKEKLTENVSHILFAIIVYYFFFWYHLDTYYMVRHIVISVIIPLWCIAYSGSLFWIYLLQVALQEHSTKPLSRIWKVQVYMIVGCALIFYPLYSLA